MRYPYNYNEDGELSAYEYALFMDEMDSDERETSRGRETSYLFGEDGDDEEYLDDPDGDGYDDGFGDEDSNDEEDWDI